MGQNLAEGLGQISDSFGKLGSAMQIHTMTKDLPGGPYMDPDVAKLAIAMEEARNKNDRGTDLMKNYEYAQSLNPAARAAFEDFMKKHPSGGGSSFSIIPLGMDPTSGQPIVGKVNKRDGSVEQVVPTGPGGSPPLPTVKTAPTAGEKLINAAGNAVQNFVSPPAQATPTVNYQMVNGKLVPVNQGAQ